MNRFNKPSNRSWSNLEVEAIVRDYFDMLMLELSGESFNKSQHRRILSTQLDRRSARSIERKHQNISAALIELRMPYISGYKPLGNYQRALLPDAIKKHVKTNDKISILLSNDAILTPRIPKIKNILKSVVLPPEPRKVVPEVVAERNTNYGQSSIDYLAQEAANISLGSSGENFVMDFERARLIEMGKANLSERVEQVSETIGARAGYDIHSYESNGTDRFIEAKTTKYGINTPFYVTRNELIFSSSHREKYFLYRVFEFRKIPRIFLLHGCVSDYCSLLPISYLARL